MLKELLSFLGIKDGKSSESEIYYAHPSHDPKNCHISNESGIEKNTGKRTSFSRTASSTKRHTEENLKNIGPVKELTLQCIRKAGREGITTFDLNELVAAELLSPKQSKKFLRQKWVKDQFFKARQELINSDQIGYNKQQKVWYFKGNPIRNLTEKEESYLTAQGLGEGWRNIANEMDAIKWLQRCFTPEEFEHFCIAILSTHCGVPVKITEKRPLSGADGGFDGTGTYEIDGKKINVAMQAKRIDFLGQVGEQHCRDFAGALMLAGWNHGFMITTGKFSDRVIEAVNVYKQKGYFIELIDQTRLAEIMLTKTTKPHGFGLHKTDYGLVYINEEILRRAAKS